MNLEGAISFAREYFRDYTIYVLRLLSRGLRRDEIVLVTDENSKLITFSLISVVVGVLLQGYFISNSQTKEIDFTYRVTFELCFWALAAAVTYLLLKLNRTPVTFEAALSAVLSVLPPVFLLGAFGAFIFYFVADAAQLDHVVKAYLGPKHGLPKEVPAIIAMLVQLFLLLRYFPRTLAQVVDGGAVRVQAIGWLVAGVVFTADMAIVFNRYT